MTTCERDHFFWLDLDAPGPDELAQLRDIFGFHPLALEDSEDFGQRPKLDDYDDYVFLVFYGAGAITPRIRSRCARCTCSSAASTS